MRVSCPHCAKQLSIEDEKLPPADRFKLTCPHCANMFTVQRENAKHPDSLPDDASASINHDFEESEFFPPGAKTAFFFLPSSNWTSTLRTLLHEQGYYFVGAEDTPTALKKIEMTAFTMIFLAHEAKIMPVLQHIHSWPGIRRRVSNIILIGEESVSLHPGASFRHGVNCFFHKKDNANARHLVQAAMDLYDETYKPWRVAAKAQGKTHI